MPQAARIFDGTVHKPCLNPGPGSKDILIGYQPAWRALPEGMADAVEAISGATTALMHEPKLTPANASKMLAELSAALAKGGAAAAANGAASSASAAPIAVSALNSVNAALSTTFAAAAAAPGGQIPAMEAYTQGIKQAAATCAGALMATFASLTDMHICPIPSAGATHGPGFVTRGSRTVFFNNLPAARQLDKVFETCGGSDPIEKGCPMVIIG